MPDGTRGVRVRAAVLREIGRPMRVEEVEVGPLRPGDVLVRIAAASLCHNDLEVIEGQLALRLPAVLGHEAAGRVAALGEGVTGLAVGDPVVLSWNPHCGHCFPRGGAAHPLRAAPGERPQGRAFRRPAAPALRRRHHHAAPAHASRRLREILRGAGAVGGAGARRHAARPRLPAGLRRHDRLRRRDAHCRHRLGLRRDGDRRRGGGPGRHPGRVAFGGGPDHRRGPEPGAEDAAGLARRLTAGRGADVVIEAAGAPAAFRASVEAVRPGGQVVWLGKMGVDDPVEFRWGALMQEKRITRSSHGGARPQQDFPAMARAYLEGRLDLDSLATARIRLEEINAGIDALRRGEAIRSVILFD